MSWVLKLLGGSGGGWILAGALLFAVASGAGAGWTARAVVADRDVNAEQTKTAQCVAGKEKARADGAEAVIAALKSGAAEVEASLNRLADAAAERAKKADRFYKELANVPVTDVCGSSPAELVYRRSAAGFLAGGVRPETGP